MPMHVLHTTSVFNVKRKGFGQLFSFVFVVIIQDTVATLIVTVVGGGTGQFNIPAAGSCVASFLRSADKQFKEALRS